MMTDDNITPSTKKTKKRRDFPPDLAKLSDKDRDKFELVLEIDSNPKSQSFNKEFLVAKSVTMQSTSTEGDEARLITYELGTLTIDNLRKLCKNIGIVNCGSHNKYNCRKAIATYFTYQDRLIATGMKPTSHSSRVTSTVCRAINVVFSTEFIEEFKTVNDRKSRQDHETQNTNKAFWSRAALAHNSCNGKSNNKKKQSTITTEIADNEKGESEDNDDYSNDNQNVDYDSDFTPVDSFDQILYPSEDVYLSDLDSNDEINLLEVDQFTTEAFRKKILDLFKIRRKMKQNMSVSGTHDNEVWNFVEAAMVGFDTGFTKIAVYYFYVRCEQTLGIDSAFQPFLDKSILGDSEYGWTEDESDNDPKSSSKKRDHDNSVPDQILEGLLQQGQTLIQQFADAAEDRQKAIENQKIALETQREALKVNKKRVKFNARLEVAKALNDVEELRKLMEEARSMETEDDD
jgi:hypothetical protein